MPNVLDAEPIRAFVRHAAGKLAGDEIGARFRRMAFAQLLADPRNFRPATAAELETAPHWARKALARGEEIVVFALYRGAAARLRTVARRLGDTCSLALLDEPLPPRHVAAAAEARDFLDKLNRVSFDIMARKTLQFSRKLACWADDRDAKPVCAPQSVAATKQRVWERITSLSQLRAIGREFHNCLARTSRSGSYGGMLRGGLAQFWVLRDHEGDGLIVAMAPAPFATCFMEARGPRNAPINCAHPDMQALARFIGIPPADAPPPASPAALPAWPRVLAELAALRAAR